jgi:hypothetical protein
VIVAAGGLLGCVAIGAMFALPVFLRPIVRDTGWSITGISAAMTIGFLALTFGSMAWGNLSDPALFGAGTGKFSAADDGHGDRRHCHGRRPGHGVGAAGGRAIYDTFASYTWMYVGASGMGLGVFLIALTFKPMTGNPTAPSQTALYTLPA